MVSVSTAATCLTCCATEPALRELTHQLKMYQGHLSTCNVFWLCVCSIGIFQVSSPPQSLMLKVMEVLVFAGKPNKFEVASVQVMIQSNNLMIDIKVALMSFARTCFDTRSQVFFVTSKKKCFSHVFSRSKHKKQDFWLSGKECSEHPSCRQGRNMKWPTLCMKVS